MANALAATIVIVFVACRVLVGLFPDLSFAVAQSWFHGVALSKLDTWDLTASSFFLGLISSTITAWVVGYLFAYIHSLLAKK